MSILLQMNKLYIFLFVFVIHFVSQAQEHVLTGVVSGVDGVLPGVTVSVVGTTKGTFTDMDGNYSISVEPGATLNFEFIGYKSAVIQFQNQTTLDVVLKETAESLEELLIQVPYGTANRSTYTGSVGVVKAKMIEQSQVSNVSKVLEGTVAGLQSFSESGQPGSEATIRIRGVGSVNASSDPLYVVDGVPYEGGLSAIASSDIASITVLKDATAATLYGSRAANGVIMITTKQGRRDTDPAIEISAKYGVSSRARADYKQLDTNRYFELFWEAIRNGQMDNANMSSQEAAAYASKNIVGMIGINPYGISNTEPIGLDGKLKSGLQTLWNDDWVDALAQSAHYTDLNLRVSGGGKNAQYYISGGYLNDQGAILKSGFKRFSLRSNLVVDVKDWLELGLNASGAHSIQDYPQQDDSAVENVVGFARGIPSFYPVYERDLNTGAYLLDPLTGNRIFDYGNYRATSYARYNLLGSLPYDKNQIKRDVATIRTYAQVSFLEHLKLKTSLNVDYNSRYKHDYQNPEFGANAAANGGSVTKQNDRNVSMTFNNVLNYKLDIDDFNALSLMAGQEYYQFQKSYFGGTRQQIIENGFYEPDAASVLVDFYGKSDEYKMLSFFGNAQYSFDNKYFFSGSFRRDGSSRFYNKWGDFWSVGASWRVIDEVFMDKLRNSWLSNLMLKASYGAQGNDNIAAYYAYQALYVINNNLGEPGLVTSRLDTKKLSWETNLNSNLGFDFGFLENRITGTFEYFERNSKDLLFNRALAPSLGFTSISENVGKVKNYGLELSLEGTPILKDDWKWTLGLNATTYKNKIVALPASEMWSADGTKKWVEGGSLYDFYLIEWAGVNPENGNPQWYRFDEQGTRIITEDYSETKDSDRVKQGSSLPKLTGGFQTNVTYKGWELTANFTYTLGGKIYNRDKLGLMHLGSAGRTWSADMEERWTPENPNANIPRLTTDPKSSWTNQSDRFLVDRSFLKLKNITLSYNFPQQWLQKIDLKAASVYVQAENLFTWTKEQGMDPEQTFNGTTYYRYPAMKTISFGINLNL